MRAVTAFHFDLVQDVAVLRPVVRLAAGMDSDLLFLVSPGFAGLDTEGVWMQELQLLVSEVGAELVQYRSPFEVAQRLSRRRGVCMAGSESTAAAHRRSHEMFRALPSGILRITLQHGFECVGFLHNERHSATAGRDVRFAADIIVGWFGRARLTDIAASERAKLYVAGPATMIDRVAGVAGTVPTDFDPYSGVICENTHSVRFGSQDAKQDFLRQLDVIATKVHSIGKTLWLRPHPAGQFLQRSTYKLPAAVEMSGGPLYRMNLSRFSFAISAPSTVLFDFALADVPVAIWGRPPMDISNFSGLPVVQDEDDCWRFVSDSVLHRDSLIANQRRFVGHLELPPDVRGRYCALLSLSHH